MPAVPETVPSIKWNGKNQIKSMMHLISSIEMEPFITKEKFPPNVRHHGYLQYVSRNNSKGIIWFPKWKKNITHK